MTILEAEAEFMDSVVQTKWYKDLLAEFISFLGLEKEARLLDVGCATGFFVRTVAGQGKEELTAGLDSLEDVARAILRVMGVDSQGGDSHD